MDDIYDGLTQQYLSTIESYSFRDIILIAFPEIEILGKSLGQILTNKEYEINDKEVFHDPFMFNSQDTIRLSRKTSIEIKSSVDTIETIYSKAILETDLKNYVLDKFLRAWRKLGVNHKIIKPLKKKLAIFEPSCRKVIKTVVSKKTNNLAMIDYIDEEKVLVTGGTRVHCIIVKE